MILGEVIHLSHTDILDQEIQENTVVIVFLIDHILKIWNRFGIAHVIECNAACEPAWKRSGHSSIHIAILQNIFQGLCGLKNSCERHIIQFVQKCLLDLFSIELLCAVEGFWQARIELATQKLCEVSLPHAPVCIEIVADLMTIQAFQTNRLQFACRHTLCDVIAHIEPDPHWACVCDRLIFLIRNNRDRNWPAVSLSC